VGVGYAWTPQLYGDAGFEAGPGGAFRLSLEDDSGNVIPNTGIPGLSLPAVSSISLRRPRRATARWAGGQRQDDQATTPASCPRLNLNDAGGQRGYMGIELTKAPVNPGSTTSWCARSGVRRTGFGGSRS